MLRRATSRGDFIRNPSASRSKFSNNQSNIGQQLDERSKTPRRSIIHTPDNANAR
jgi:hypothetical protein